MIEFIIIFLKIPSYKNSVYTPKDVGTNNRYQTTSAEPTSFRLQNTFSVKKQQGETIEARATLKNSYPKKNYRHKIYIQITK